MPHVYARDTDDAWFAAGYLQARDRLWKMELYRRAAAGRFGEQVTAELAHLAMPKAVVEVEAAPEGEASEESAEAEVDAHQTKEKPGLERLDAPREKEREGAEIGREGCLSLPDITANVSRPVRVVVVSLCSPARVARRSGVTASLTRVTSSDSASVSSSTASGRCRIHNSASWRIPRMTYY